MKPLSKVFIIRICLVLFAFIASISFRFVIAQQTSGLAVNIIRKKILWLFRRYQ